MVLQHKKISERFSKDCLFTIEIIYDYLFGSWLKAYAVEQYLLDKLKMFKYTGPKLITSGNSELFTTDISEYVINFINTKVKDTHNEC